MLGAIGAFPLVETQEAGVVDTVYRSRHGNRVTTAGGVGATVPVACTDDAVDQTHQRPTMRPTAGGGPTSALFHSCGNRCGPITLPKGGGPRERH